MPYLKHEFNRDGDSYRSPHDNKYYPANPEGVMLPDNLRQLEVKFNEVIKNYANLYYDNATTSVYVAETDAEKGFNAAFLIKKELKHDKHIEGTCWDSIHVANVEVKDNKLHLELVSTVFVTFDSNMKDLGKMSLAGSCAKSKKKDGVPLPMDYHKNPNGVYMQ